MAARARTTDHRPPDERKQRLQAWLTGAQCRLPNKEFLLLKTWLHELAAKWRQTEDKTPAAANKLWDPDTMVNLACLLWGAEFPEGEEHHKAWCLDFAEVLPDSVKAKWTWAVGCTEPGPDPPSSASDSDTPLAAASSLGTSPS